MMAPALPPPNLAQLSLGDLIDMASAQPVLDERDEDTLIERARQGDADAREQLTMGNLRVAIDEAIRSRGWGQPQRKLVPMGVSMVLESVSSYDPRTHGPFAMYLRARVRRAMRERAGVS
jgi:DNA-directed RNA polymerase specialized sigma subunit